MSFEIVVLTSCYVLISQDMLQKLFLPTLHTRLILGMLFNKISSQRFTLKKLKKNKRILLPRYIYFTKSLNSDLKTAKAKI